MSWIKLDDQWMDHPKVIAAGRDARDMWLASITYCSKHLTDGYFHPNLLPALAVMAGLDVANCQSFARTLLDVCLWDATDNGYMVHDFLDYNPTKEQALATREARKEAGRAGGVAKASKMPSKTLAKGWQNSSKSLPPPRTPLTPLNNADDKSSDKPPKKVADPLLENPAIMEYRRIVKMQMPAVLRQAVADQVTNVELWGTIVYDWIGFGWNKQNIKGMLEAYTAGGIQRKNGSKPTQDDFHPSERW